MNQKTNSWNWGYILPFLAIGFVWALINRHPAAPQVEALPPVKDFKPTAENEAKLHQFMLDVLHFTVLHEMGHLVFHQYHVPVGSPADNEMAADSFAAAIILATVNNGASQQYNGLMSAAAFWQALGELETENATQQARAQEQNGTDPHPPAEQRAKTLACVLYGTNPKAFADVLQVFKVEDSPDSCVQKAIQARRTWSNVVSVNLDPDAGNRIDRWAPYVAVVYRKVPDGLPNGWSPILSRGQRIAQDLAILDGVGNNLLLLKTPFNIGAAIARGAQDSNRSQSQFRLGDPMTLNPPIQNYPSLSYRPHVDHPSEDASPSAYDFMVVGDSCLQNRNEPEANAWWDPDTHTVTLCYAWVNEIEYIGKRLLAETH